MTTQAMAAGLTIKQTDFEQFQHGFEAVVRSLITEADLESVLEVDGNLSNEELNFKVAEILESQVWGQGFAPPLFYDEFEVLNQKLVGEKHLKLTLKKASTTVDAIYFNQTDFVGERIQAAYQLQTNSYNGAQKAQLNIRYIA